MILPPFYLSAKQMPGMELLCGPISRQNKKVVTPGDTVISGWDLKTAIWKFPAIFSAACSLSTYWKTSFVKVLAGAV